MGRAIQGERWGAVRLLAAALALAACAGAARAHCNDDGHGCPPGYNEDLPQPSSCSTMKGRKGRRGCIRSSSCMWMGKGGGCMDAPNVCEAVQKKKKMRKACEATAMSSDSGATKCICSNPREARRGGRKRRRKCGSCKGPSTPGPSPPGSVPAIPLLPGNDPPYTQVGQCASFMSFPGATFSVTSDSSILMYTSNASLPHGDTPGEHGGHGHSKDHPGNGMGAMMGSTIVHSLIVLQPSGDTSVHSKVMGHAHALPCGVDQGGPHWMHNVTKPYNEMSNELHIHGDAGKWIVSKAAWQVNKGTMGNIPYGDRPMQQAYPQSVVLHDHMTKAKAVCCDLTWS